eukprot:6802222-Prymnesium_polylepis.1
MELELDARGWRQPASKPPLAAALSAEQAPVACASSRECKRDRGSNTMICGDKQRAFYIVARQVAAGRAAPPAHESRDPSRSPKQKHTSVRLPFLAGLRSMSEIPFSQTCRGDLLDPRTPSSRIPTRFALSFERLAASLGGPLSVYQVSFLQTR